MVWVIWGSFSGKGLLYAPSTPKGRKNYYFSVFNVHYKVEARTNLAHTTSQIHTIACMEPSSV